MAHSRRGRGSCRSRRRRRWARTRTLAFVGRNGGTCSGTWGWSRIGEEDVAGGNAVLDTIAHQEPERTCRIEPRKGPFGLLAVQAHAKRPPGGPSPVEPGPPDRLEGHALAPAHQPGIGDGGEGLEGGRRRRGPAMRGQARRWLLQIRRKGREIDAGADDHLAAVWRGLARALQ